MIVYIYGLFDPRNDELRYIGKTVNHKMRLGTHLCNARNGEPDLKYVWIRELLERDLEPYMLIFEECTDDNWEKKEKKWISDSFNNGVNLTNVAYGGEETYWTGKKQSKEHIKKRVESRLKNDNYGHSEETKYKISKANKGKNLGNTHTLGKKVHSEEWKAHLRTLTGEKSPSYGKEVSEETKAKIRKTKLGTKLSEETKRKISEGNKGKQLSPEHVEAIRQANLGKVHSDETKEKIRQIRLGSHQTEKTKQKIKDLWTDPEYREKTLAAQEKARKLNPIKKGRKLTAEQREAASIKRKQQWQDPEYRAKMLAAQRKRRQREQGLVGKTLKVESVLLIT